MVRTMANARSRLPWIIGGTAALVLAGLLIPRQPTRSHQAETGSSVVSIGHAPAPRPVRKVIPARGVPRLELVGLPELPAPVNPPRSPGSSGNEDWIVTRIEEINALTWFDDPASLGGILAELRNPLPEIQTAALEATKTFGSRDAIPYLQAMARETPESQKLQGFNDAIEFLKRPTLLEVTAADFGK